MDVKGEQSQLMESYTALRGAFVSNVEGDLYMGVLPQLV